MLQHPTLDRLNSMGFAGMARASLLDWHARESPHVLEPTMDWLAARSRQTYVGLLHAEMRRLGSLTPQQVRVLMMLSEGLLNKQIAYELGVSEATVKAHVSAILQKLGVESRTQAVIAAGKIETGQWPHLPAREG